MDDPGEIDEVLFEAALGMDSAQAREALFRLIGEGDAERAERLRSLAAVQLRADSFFRKAEGARTAVATEAGEALIDPDHPPQPETQTEAADEQIGGRIGRYRLKKRIGEGGCGVFYLAEQLEPVKRMVALKVIRLGMDTERVIARFEMERQALALMDHPNIARVLDGGATDAGRPYFVMEWVRGARVTDYCDAAALTVRERIDLFGEICRGIQHAHQKGVIHRDIKPSNILIDDENGSRTPKIIDFGIAKAISGEAGADTHLSFQDQMIGTPAYMSPEQADRRERDIDTRSDVYSLGVLLYELLVGRTPFDAGELSSAGLSEMRRMIIEREPLRPSAMFASMDPGKRTEIAARRHCDPARLFDTLRGDLDSVVMKAIEKDRGNRYETVNGFVMDLQRYIHHEPVIARPANRAYLFRKFVRRNRLAVGASAAIVVSLLLGIGIAFSYYLRERRALEEQVRLRKFADAAHRNELLRLAEARGWENFAHVSVLLSEGKTQEADEQLRKTPISSIQLTPQSAAVLRSLGNWNALRGRWPQSAECFHMLMRAEDLNHTESLTDSFDLVAIASVLIECGSTRDFAAFREWAVGKFGSNGNPLDASRLLHSVLLVPADVESIKPLESLIPLMEKQGFDLGMPPGRDRELAIWSAFGLSLLEYRLGNFERARHWSETALAFKANRDYINGALEPVHAMICYRLGDLETANAHLKRARGRVEKAFSPELPAAYEPFGSYQGFWWDWIIMRTLYREADALIHGRETLEKH